MPKAIVILTLLASLMAFSGCSEGGDGGGAGGSGASGGGSGSAAFSFDAKTALPATSASATAMAFAAAVGSTLGTVLAAVDPDLLPAAPSVTPKVDLPLSGACPGGGSVSVDQTGSVVTVGLTDCLGVGVGAAPVSGEAVLTITDTGSIGLSISATATLDLEIGTDTVVEGEFVALVDLARVGQLHVRLGDALDGDRLTVTETGQTVLQLGCFDISLAFDLVPSGLRLLRITPFGVASAQKGEIVLGEVFTINDYTPRVTSIGESVSFDQNGLASAGEMTLYSGDRSSADTDRGDDGKASCPGFGGVGNGSFVTAAFSPGGCVALAGVDRDGTDIGGESSWEKLLEGDLSPGGGPGCGPTRVVMCNELQAGEVSEIIDDSDFEDSVWEVEIVATDGAVFEAPISRETSGGVAGTAFRRMTHTIEDATNCAESCSLGVVHKIAKTYDPSEGAIKYINYTEAQRLITPGFDGAAVGWAFAVVQDGRRYNALPQTPSFTNTAWAINGLCGLTAEDFGPVDGPHPDFTTNGGELAFAYIRSNSNTSEVSAITNIHGIDDFEVVIVKE